jgi:MraZ protein
MPGVIKSGARDAVQRFRSRSEHSLDPKGRLNIPTRFRDVLRERYSENLVVTNWKNCLRAYPVPEWEALEEKLLNEGKTQANIGKFVRYLISGVTECPLDKQGRILLPPTLRTELGIARDVVLVGMLEHFEIWDKVAWEEEARHTRETFEEFNDGLSALGIF